MNIFRKIYINQYFGNNIVVIVFEIQNFDQYLTHTKVKENKKKIMIIIIISTYIL